MACTVYTEVTGASGKGEEAFRWVVATEAKTASFESLRDSQGFDSLDAKLAAALTKLATGELGRRVNLATWLLKINGVQTHLA